MPQMSPCSWLTLILITNLMMNVTKLNIFFEKKC
uniref:ATP synthase F0 subunit 8 n=1 Tax=Perkinsiella saccharicida TaxID=312347 RepID=A0A7S4Z1B4_9HEMI|nr:ATP synthase F0 subunit 8 [Perkinsiella saccharicida]QBZ38033.1 ATP synthase F0 subunit 8 [Perkinsiella saccharicida]